MFRRLFALETAALMTTVDQGCYRQDQPPLHIDGHREAAGLGSSFFGSGLGSAPFGSGLWSRRSAA